jgi:hypothetical protein
LVFRTVDPLLVAATHRLDAELLMLDLRRFPIFADLEPAGR